MDSMTVLVGTPGQGVLTSFDGGKTWERSRIEQGMHSVAIVRAMINDPLHPEIVFAGTDIGLYRSDNGGRKWQLLDTPLSSYCVWALAVDSKDPNLMFAGTGTPAPASIWRSADGGKSWEQRPVEIAKETRNVGVPRVTGIAIDPVNRSQIWFGLEVDGLRRSTDGGDSWEDINGAFHTRDVHNVLVTQGPPKTVVVAVVDDVYTSTDDGNSWKPVRTREVFPWPYTRSLAVRPDKPEVIFVTTGDDSPGQTGAVMRSKDAGKTWEPLWMPVQPNTAMWVVNVLPCDPNVVFASSRYGYLYRSDDGGDTWRKLWREFSEISSVVWVPN